MRAGVKDAVTWAAAIRVYQCHVVRFSYHKAFQEEITRAIPWQARRGERPGGEWVLWMQEDYRPVLERLAGWCDQA